MRSLSPASSMSWIVLMGVLFGVVSVGAVGCRRYRDDLDYSFTVKQTWALDDFSSGEFVQFDEVFWESDDTISLRDKIANDQIAANRAVLEIGTGTGLLSIFCLHHDAKRVVATDINPAAVANARYNAAMLVPDRELDVRQVPADAPGAFTVIDEGERFDLILSNPPWEDGAVDEPLDHAFYDPSFALMDTLLDGLPKHLKPGGRCLLAYGHVPAIKRLERAAKQRHYEFKILDDRDLDTLPADFLPGMLVEIRLPIAAAAGDGS